jgi:hypothetical protein
MLEHLVFFVHLIAVLQKLLHPLPQLKFTKTYEKEDDQQETNNLF